LSSIGQASSVYKFLYFTARRIRRRDLAARERWPSGRCGGGGTNLVGRLKRSPKHRSRRQNAGATGTRSRRLPITSRNQVENRVRESTSEEAADGDNRRRLNELTPEVARHQKVIDHANFVFDSRRLHQFFLGNLRIRPHFPAASTISPLAAG
jgi:hypothetical protein